MANDESAALEALTDLLDVVAAVDPDELPEEVAGNLQSVQALVSSLGGALAEVGWPDGLAAPM